MQIAKMALIACALFGFILLGFRVIVWRDQDWSRCQDSDAYLRIDGCTAVIQGGGQTSPNLARAFYNRGAAYATAVQYDRAIQDFDQAIRLEPDFAEAFNGRGSAYSDEGQYDRAIQDYDEAIRLTPDYADAFNNRGNAYLNKGQYDSAVQDYDEAVRLEPDYAYPFNNRGIAYYLTGQYDSAIQDYDQAIRLKPDEAKSFNGRALAYSNAGQYDHAIQDYDQAIRLKPDYENAFNNRGRTKFFLAHFLGAAADFQNGLSLDSSNAYTVLWLHLAKKRAGQDDGQGFAQQARHIDPSKWAAVLVNLFLGNSTPQQTLAAAPSPDFDCTTSGSNADTCEQTLAAEASPDSIKRKGWQRCEAEFFIGEYFLLRQETPKAVAHFRAARDVCPPGYTGNYDSGAAAEIARLGAGAEFGKR
ncbi:MAG: tetratricopeptide repeat protein [Terriglobia bacterium]